MIPRGLARLALLGCLLCPWAAWGQPVQGTLKPQVLNYATSGDKTLVAAVAGQTIRVYEWFLVCNGAVNLTLTDSTPTTLLPVVACAAAGCGWVEDLHREHPRYVAAVGKALVLNLSANTQCSGHFSYTQGAD